MLFETSGYISLSRLYLLHDLSATLLSSLALIGQVSLKDLYTLPRSAVVVSFALRNTILV